MSRAVDKLYRLRSLIPFFLVHFFESIGREGVIFHSFYTSLLLLSINHPINLYFQQHIAPTSPFIHPSILQPFAPPPSSPPIPRHPPPPSLTNQTKPTSKQHHIIQYLPLHATHRVARLIRVAFSIRTRPPKTKPLFHNFRNLAQSEIESIALKKRG